MQSNVTLIMNQNVPSTNKLDSFNTILLYEVDRVAVGLTDE